MAWDSSTDSAGTASSPGKTRVPLSESWNVDSGIIHTDPSGTGARPESTGLLPLESTGAAAVTDQTTAGSAVWTESEDTLGSSSQTGLLAGPNDSSGSAFRGTGSGTGQIIQPTVSGGRSETSPSSTGGYRIPTESGTFDATSDSAANPSSTLIQYGSNFSASAVGQIATTSTEDDLSTGYADASSTIEPIPTETAAPTIQTCFLIQTARIVIRQMEIVWPVEVSIENPLTPKPSSTLY